MVQQNIRYVPARLRIKISTEFQDALQQIRCCYSGSEMHLKRERKGVLYKISALCKGEKISNFLF